ncbi:hypothetical protein L6452_44386 [Arctium lappa]|uniref:Uncharacterized protein n=1 Tax=Arctium lappa TaxID=4217 RepID=A0ACB8XGQ0_ARCLA|nr:hypothetical protein L6452_44386 [Arctium lappa]
MPKLCVLGASSAINEDKKLWRKMGSECKSQFFTEFYNLNKAISREDSSAMASTSSNLLLNTFSRRRSSPVTTVSAYKAQCPKSTPPAIRSDSQSQSRRQMLFLMTATTAVKALEMPSMAEDIGLFGLRKKLKKAEEEAEEIVKEGIESAEKGLEAAERGIETAEKEIATDVSFGIGGGLTQAGVVVGAEAAGVLIATSVVNGILGPEG